jgi:Ca2+-binding EF-hand superfamily protein
MMNLFDRDHSGFITFDEFAGLWKYIEDWKRCFQGFDTDHNGSINALELRRALLSFGYNLSEQMVTMMIKKYDKRGRGDVTFDNFIQICVTVRTLSEAFKRYDADGDGWITIGYEQFLQLVVFS